MPSETSPALRYPGTEHVFGLVDRLRLGWLLKHFPPLLVWTLYVFVNGFITIALLSLLAVLRESRLIYISARAIGKPAARMASRFSRCRRRER